MPRLKIKIMIIFKETYVPNPCLLQATFLHYKIYISFITALKYSTVSNR